VFVERCTEIERQNRLLLAKMTNIMSGDQKQVFTQLQVNKPRTPLQYERYRSVQPQIKLRIREIAQRRLSDENEAFLKRLQD